jgi:hypothetical protein
MDYRGPVSVFSVLLKHMGTHIGELPMDIRCDIAIKLAAQADFNSPELFLFALHCDRISPPTMNYQNKNGVTLLHAVAGALAILCNAQYTKYIHPKDRERWISGWNSILRALVTGGADLHVTCPLGFLGLGHVQATPFLFMSSNPYSFGSRKLSALINPQDSVSSWISILSDSGINLTEYANERGRHGAP